MSNVITARFDGKTTCTTDSAYQYDYGQVLYFPDLTLPTAFECHFANLESGTSYTQVGTNNRVTIPDDVFQGLPSYYQSNKIYAWVYLHTGNNDGETEYRAIIPLIRRAEPSDEEPTTTEQSAINQAIEALNTAVDTVEGYLGNYATVVLGETQGNPIRITDGTDEVPVKSLVLQLTPKQSGTGAPSPSNVRAITGATGANIYVTGKNLFNESDMYSGYYPPSINNLQPDSAYRTVVIDNLPAGTYTFSTTLNNPYLLRYWSDGENHGASKAASNHTFTTTTDGLFMMCFRNTSSTEITETFNTQVEVGSTATSYEPYLGTTYPVSWSSEAGTVYGGYVDVVSGTLTKTHGYVDLGTLYWNYVPSQTRFYAVLSTADMPTSSTEKADILCDRYAVTSFNDLQYGNENNVVAGYSNGTASFVQIRNTNYTTESALTSALSGVYLYYPLANPVTYSITPVEISTILGLNHIWSDTGFINPLVYCLDTKTYIEQNSVKAPSIIGTASGSVASFSDGADQLNMESLIVNIEPKQSGSGTPSPSNIRAISGWTGCNAYVTGKNLIPFPYASSEGTVNGITWEIDEIGHITGTGTTDAGTNFSLKRYIYLRAGTYTLSITGNHTGMNLLAYDNDNARVLAKINSSSASASASFTVSCDISDFEVYFNIGSSGVSVSIDADVQVEVGSTATTYEAYNGTVYPVTWSSEAGTIYGGYADVVNGTLTVDRAFYKGGWTQYNTSNGYIAYRQTGVYGKANNASDVGAMCNMISEYGSFTSSSMSKNIIQLPNPTSNIIYMALDENIDPDDVEVSYLVLTPLTYNIGTEQIKTLLGTNNVFADCGSIKSCQYVADTKKYIDNAIATAIASL